LQEKKDKHVCTCPSNIELNIPIFEPAASINWQNSLNTVVLGESYTLVLDLGDGNNYDLSNFPAPSVVGGAVSSFSPVPGSSSQYTTFFTPDGSSNIVSIDFPAGSFQDTTAQFLSVDIPLITETSVVQPTAQFYFANDPVSLIIGDSYPIVLDLGIGSTYAVGSIIPSSIVGGSVSSFQLISGSSNQYMANFIPDGTNQNALIQFAAGTFTSSNGLFSSPEINLSSTSSVNPIVEPAMTLTFDNNLTTLSVNTTYPITLDLGKYSNYLQRDPDANFPEIYITSGDVSAFVQDTNNTWIYHANFTPTTTAPYEVYFPTGSFFSKNATFISTATSLPPLPVNDTLSVEFRSVMKMLEIGSNTWDLTLKANRKLEIEPSEDSMMANTTITWNGASAANIPIKPISCHVIPLTQTPYYEWYIGFELPTDGTFTPQPNDTLTLNFSQIYKDAATKDSVQGLSVTKTVK